MKWGVRRSREGRATIKAYKEKKKRLKVEKRRARNAADKAEWYIKSDNRYERRMAKSDRRIARKQYKWAKKDLKAAKKQYNQDMKAIEMRMRQAKDIQ